MKRPLKKAIAFITVCALTMVIGVTNPKAATEYGQTHYAVNSVIGNNYNAFINTPNATLLISGAPQDPVTTEITRSMAATELVGQNTVMDMVTSTGEVVRINNSIGFTKFAGINSGDSWKCWDWRPAENNSGYTLLNSEHIIVVVGNNKLALLMNNGKFYKDGELYDGIDYDRNGFWYFTTGRVVTVCSPEMIAVTSKTFESTSDARSQMLDSANYGEYFRIFDDYYTIDGIPCPVGVDPSQSSDSYAKVDVSPAMKTKITAVYTSEDGGTASVELGKDVIEGRVVSGLQNVTFYDGNHQPITTVEKYTGSVFTENYLVAYGIGGLASIDLGSETLKTTATGSFIGGSVIVPADNTVILERGEYVERTSEYGSYTEARRTDAYRLYCAEMGTALSTTYSDFEFGTDSSNGTIYIVKDSSDYQGILNKRGFSLVEPGGYTGIAYLEGDISIFKSSTDTSFDIINTTNGRTVSRSVYINYILPPPDYKNDRYYWIYESYWGIDSLTWNREYGEARKIRPSTDGGLRMLPYYRHSNGNYSIITTNESGSEYSLLFLRKQ